MNLAKLLLGIPRKAAADPAIGAAFGGGYYFGKMNIDGLLYWMVVAPISGAAVNVRWRNSATAVTTARSLYDGAANCASIVDASTYPAINYCLNYVDPEGNEDYYLGALYENELMYRNLKPDTTSNITTGLTASFSANQYSSPAGATYTASSPAQTVATDFITPTGSQRFPETSSTADPFWSSTVDGQSFAWVQLYRNGTLSTLGINNARRVRPIRKILIPGQ